MRGGTIGMAALAALACGLTSARAAEVVAGGLAFDVDPKVWSAAGDHLQCRADDCEGATLRVRRVAGLCDDALLAAAATQQDFVPTTGTTRVVPARGLEVRVLVLRNPCRSWSADPFYACVALAGSTRLLTIESDGGRRCAAPPRTTGRVLDLLGRIGAP